MRGDKVILFWSKYDPAIDTEIGGWQSREISYNPSATLTLQTHLRFGHDVTLYTYQAMPQGISAEVNLRDASEIYPATDAWDALTRGHEIAHISDLVRLRAAAHANGLVADMDSLIVNELPDLDGFFCTIPAKASGGVARKWGKSNPPFLVHDGSWDGKALSNFPTKVGESMKQPILDLADEVQRRLAIVPKKNKYDGNGTGSVLMGTDWNFVMHALKDISAELPDTKVLPPIKAGPLPGWLPPRKCFSIESPTRLTGEHSSFGYRVPSIQEILDNSFLVQHYFESAAQKVVQTERHASFWYDIPADSLIGVIAQQTVGDKWRTLLPSLATAS